MFVAESLTASITGATTVIVTVAVSQFVGLAISQIWYVMVYGPAGVPGITSTLPFGFKIKFGFETVVVNVT